MPDPLDVVVAFPLDPALLTRLAGDPRLRVHHEPALLPPPVYPGDKRGDPAFRRDEAGDAAWAGLLRRADVMLGVPRESAEGFREVLAGAPQVRFIQATNAGAGQHVAEVGVDDATLERLVIASAAGVHAGPLAEFAVLGLLALARDLPGLLRDQRAHRWPEHRRLHRELAGGTLLIVGLGGIGRETARLASVLGMRVVGVRRDPSRDVPGVDEIHATDRLAELLPHADAVVITLPLTDATRGLFDAGTLAAMKPGALLVNVGRGGVVDEAALVEALRSGHLGGAALDVFATEPLPPDSPLWDLDNVLISPHVAALSEHENARIVDLFLDNVGRFLAGEPVRNRILPDRPY